MKRTSSRNALLGLALCALFMSPSADAAGRRGRGVVGVWYGTIYFGPAEPATPKLQMAFTFHSDGTIILDSSSETGEHPLLPGEKSVFHGVWKRRGRVVHAKGFAFDEGGPEGFSILRGVTELRFEGRHTLEGLADFDFLLCEGGPLDCPDPTDGEFLDVGNGVGPFPFVLKRFR